MPAPATLPEVPDPQLLQIRKYPNRRLYDQSRSRHLTVDDLYDAVVAGHTVVVTDSRTGRDITNAVLFSALIERDGGKLAALPPEVVHLMIRATETVLQSFMAQWFAQFLRAAAPGGFASPMGGMPFAGAPGTSWWPRMPGVPGVGAPAPSPPAASEPPPNQAEISDDLADRIDRLSRELEALRDAANARGGNG